MNKPFDEYSTVLEMTQELDERLTALERAWPSFATAEALTALAVRLSKIETEEVSVAAAIDTTNAILADVRDLLRLQLEQARDSSGTLRNMLESSMENREVEEAEAEAEAEQESATAVPA